MMRSWTGVTQGMMGFSGKMAPSSSGRMRFFTVAGVSGLEPPPDRLLDEAAHYVWRAARMGADIVAFPEFYPLTGLSQQHWTAAAEEIPGDGRGAAVILRY